MSIEQCKKYVDVIRSLVIEHSEYSRVLEEAYTHLALADADTVVMVVGPTRVGKSSIRRVIADRLSPRDSGTTSRFRHTVCVEAANAQGGLFSMKHLTLRALAEVSHPIYGHTEDMPDQLPKSLRISRSETYLRLALEKAMIYRQTRWFLVDEAHHLLRVGRRERAADILDSLKCLGNTTGAAIGLFGGYDLLDAGLASAHLNGRMRIAHFRRYGDSNEDVHEFDRVIELLDRAAPSAAGFSLLQYRDALRDGSVGCIGMLLVWVKAALALAATEGEFQGLAKRHFVATRFENQLQEIREEIEKGEALLERIKFPKDPPYQAKPDDAKPKKGAVKPFTRRPARDPVGTA
jgi:hypothetical protein